MNAANAAAVEAICAVEPVWIGQTYLRDVLVLDGVSEIKMLLHAGPSFTEWEAVPQAIRNSMAQAVVFENWASSVPEAENLLASGAVNFSPAQDYECVVPLAGVISPSMGVHIITDSKNHSKRSYAAINEGMDHLLRVGKLDEHLVGFHQWLNGDFNEFLKVRLEKSAGIPLLPLLAESLNRGDDAHSRTMAGSALLAQEIRDLDGQIPSKKIARFLDQAVALALNLWMAAAALALRAAEDFSEADLVTKVGGNGVEFGFQIASRPGIWNSKPGSPPVGPVSKEFESAQVLGAVGDSAVVDFYGLGGGALHCAPDTVSALEGFLPERVVERFEEMFLQEHPMLPIRTGISRAKTIQSGITPIVLLGMIEATGVDGRIGGGAYMPNPSVFA